MSKLFKTQKEKDEHIYKMLGVTKWYKWKTYLTVSFYHIGIAMIAWCILFGIVAMGYKLFWISALVIGLLELIRATLSHIYYLIKWKIKKSRRKSQ